jgi:hypothetical protein
LGHVRRFMRQYAPIGMAAGEDVRTPGKRLNPQGSGQVWCLVEPRVADVNTGDRSH